MDPRRPGILSPVMHMESKELRDLLSRNAVAKGIVEAMTEEQRKLFLTRLQEKKNPDEQMEYINSIVGWQKGHPPYQC